MIGWKTQNRLRFLSGLLIVAGVTALDRPALADRSGSVPAVPNALLAALQHSLDGVAEAMGSNPQILAVMAEIRAQAQRGDARSQRVLGDLYSIQAFAGSTEDGEQAMSWWRKAAEQGEVIAMDKLAGAYALGKLVPQDAALSLSWARKAADKDDPAAELQLGSAYELGFGVPKDKAQALVWYRKAEAHGGILHGMAESAIAGLDRQDRPPTPAPSGFYNLKSQAVAGNAEAQTRLGLIYADEASALRDDREAAHWFAKAAQQGNAQAMSELSGLYLFGRGVPGDLSKSAYWLREAASRGRVEDEINLSESYYVGILGQPRDMAQSVAWLQKAAEQGSAKAQQKLAFLYQTGQRGVPRDDAKSLYWMKKSADQRYCLAEQMMAQRYQLGIGSPRDNDQARAWYAKAADHPDSDFCQNESEESLKAIDRRLAKPD